jgi:hypothetical protein
MTSSLQCACAAKGVATKCGRCALVEAHRLRQLKAQGLDTGKPTGRWPDAPTPSWARR